MFTLLATQIRAFLRQRLGESGQAELIVVLLLIFLIWVLATHRRVILQ